MQRIDTRRDRASRRVFFFCVGAPARSRWEKNATQTVVYGVENATDTAKYGVENATDTAKYGVENATQTA